MDLKQHGIDLLREFQGDTYAFGCDQVEALGPYAAELCATTSQHGRRAAVVTSGVGKPWGEPLHRQIRQSLEAAGVEIAGGLIAGPKPNTPTDDVQRIADHLTAWEYDVLVAVGGGSTLDGTKAALALSVLGPHGVKLDDMYGVGRVTALLAQHGQKLPPLVAMQTASASASHITRNACATDPVTLQKMLIADDLLTPARAVFDYGQTLSMSPEFTADGALDGVSHCFEVLMGLKGERLEQGEPICLTGIELIIGALTGAINDPHDEDARFRLALGTDLGGCALMLGGTNGAHLNSFSVVDLLSHGRACAVMNPYYAVLFAPAIEDKLRKVGQAYQRTGFSDADFNHLSGRELGIELAESMHRLARQIGFPTTLDEIDGFTDDHVERMLTAAKNPKLAAKLQAMPIPMTADMVDRYMGALVAAARSGDFSRIEMMES